MPREGGLHSHFFAFQRVIRTYLAFRCIRLVLHTASRRVAAHMRGTYFVTPPIPSKT